MDNDLGHMTDILAFIDRFGPYLGTSIVGTILTLLGVKELVHNWQRNDHEQRMVALNHVVSINTSLLRAVQDIQDIKQDISTIKKKLKINGKIDSTGLVSDALERISVE